LSEEIMADFVDLHCHLLAGLDDGPRSADDALAMCRIAAGEGVRFACALAHQNERWQVPPEGIRTAVEALRGRLADEGVPLEVFATAEVTASPKMEEDWAAGRLLSLADRAQYLLVEMPHGLFVDLRPTVRRLARRGLRLILAHPERHPELLHDVGVLEELVELGCLVQVSSGSLTDPGSPPGDRKALRSWFRRGCVHFLGSDGHSPRRRPPLMAEACGIVRDWVGAEAAARVCSGNGLHVLRGEPLAVAAPRPQRCWWPLRLC
jgi:protein-tyrosine phosphatase